MQTASKMLKMVTDRRNFQRPLKYLFFVEQEMIRANRMTRINSPLNVIPIRLSVYCIVANSKESSDDMCHTLMGDHR